MTKKETQYLERIYNILLIPNINWKNSNIIPGLQSYYKEAIKKIDIVRSILYCLGTGESYKGEIEEKLQEIENTEFDRN